MLPITALVCFTLLQTPALAPVHTPKGYADAWDAIEKRITQGFYAKAKRGDEMKRLFAQYKAPAEAAKTDDEFRNQVEAMIHDFGDSHFDFFTKDDQGFYMMDGLIKPKPAEMPFIGAWFKKSGNDYVVQMVLNDTEAATADMRPGDKMISANGQPFEPVKSFQTDGKSVHITFERSGRQFEKDVTPTMTSAVNAFLTATQKSARVIDYHGKKIGYIHLWTQANDSFRNAVANAVNGKLANTDAFILDLRDGFGGRPEGFADPFFRPAADLKWTTGSGLGYTTHFGYSKPLVTLINHGSRSAKEILSYVLKKSHRSVLVGTTTAGNVLGTSPNPIFDWAYLEMPLVDVQIDGIRLEKHGVVPDIVVDPESSTSGTDLVLERGLQVAANAKT